MMIICISTVLDSEALGKVRDHLARSAFGEGARTAGWHARAVKDNEQADPLDPDARAAADLVAAALVRHEVFRSAVLPLRLRPPLLARYAPGRSYGAHTDDALMGASDPADPRAAPQVRTDVAVTVFLSNPADYDGGELVVETTAGEQEFRLDAGDAVTYPAGTLHRVAPVTRGERLAAVTWVQSLVRDPSSREILFDLDAARRDVFGREGKSRTFDLLTKSHAGLLRRWAAT